MTDPGYEVLHYRGDVTSADGAQPGALLGHDEAYQPYEVLDAEYDPATDRTTVQLQHARPETLRAAQQSLLAELGGGR